jgi:cysteine desulfurase family protein (TIGR01976 family)
MPSQKRARMEGRRSPLSRQEDCAAARPGGESTLGCVTLLQRPPSLAMIRAAFPALSRDEGTSASTSWALLENAGGSQVPEAVIAAVQDYMRTRFVQLGAGYPKSDAATATVERAHAFVNLLVGGTGHGSVMLGPSTTQLCSMLANCYADRLLPGDEIVLSEAGHEANIGPWLRLERKGVKIKWWRVDPTCEDCTLATLDESLSSRTRIIAFPHVSNLLGRVSDVAEVTRRAHAVGARVVVDGVAYAPHRPIDVAAWDVDWYVYSTYKVYGPHMAALYGRGDAIGELDGPNHFFIPKDQVPYKFELGGACHEGCAGIAALGEYLAFLSGADDEAAVQRSTIVSAFERMTELERPLQEMLLRGLGAMSNVRVVGGLEDATDLRVPTVSFLHRRKSPSEVTAALHKARVAARHGHMYAYRLCQVLGIDVGQGVVRISAVHYNTPDEIEQAIAAIRDLDPS